MMDAIVKQSLIKTDLPTLWTALTDYKQFGEWFMVSIDAPFNEGEVSHGQFTLEGYEHYRWIAKILQIEPERKFSFNWSPALDMEEVEFSLRPQTWVEFILESEAQGINLTIRESGFAAIQSPQDRKEAMRRNAQGWDAQLKNIAAYVTQSRD